MIYGWRQQGDGNKDSRDGSDRHSSRGWLETRQYRRETTEKEREGRKREKGGRESDPERSAE